MGRNSFILILLVHLAFPAQILASSDQIHVTASVSPSPDWIDLVALNSRAYRCGPFIIVSLSDGQHNKFASQMVTLSDNRTQLTQLTSESGTAYFAFPGNFRQLSVTYRVMGYSIPVRFSQYGNFGVADTEASWTVLGLTDVSTAASLCIRVCCFVSNTNPGIIKPITPNTKTPPTGISLIRLLRSQFLPSFSFNFDSSGGGGTGSIEYT